MGLCAEINNCIFRLLLVVFYFIIIIFLYFGILFAFQVDESCNWWCGLWIGCDEILSTFLELY